jgi:hypothetical protein
MFSPVPTEQPRFAIAGVTTSAFVYRGDNALHECCSTAHFSLYFGFFQ